MDGALISIVIPAWNALRWLPETLESVMGQEGVRLEVVLVDDGSTDGTGDYVAQVWPQVRLIQTENRGVSHARNLGTAAAHGDFVKYLDADDVLLPGTLARQAALLVANPGSDAVYGNWQRLDEQADGRFAPGEIIRRSIEEVDADPELAFFATFWCPTGAYLYQRVFLEKILPWKEWLPVIQDARFAWDAAAAGARWVHDEEIAVLYRQHRADSVSTRSRVAFLRDCLANTVSIHQAWSRPMHLEKASVKRARIVEAVASLARQAAPLDEQLFHECVCLLDGLCPGYHPPGPRWLALCARLIGYAQAAKFAGLGDRLRQQFFSFFRNASLSNQRP